MKIAAGKIFVVGLTLVLILIALLMGRDAVKDQQRMRAVERLGEVNRKLEEILERRDRQVDRNREILELFRSEDMDDQ